MDAVIIIGVFILALGVPFALAGLWWWFWFWVVIGTVLGVTEAIAALATGQTISKRFWNWKKDEGTPNWKKLLILGGMIVFWGYLLCHLFLEM